MDKKLVIEFIGTFFLVLTVAATGNPIAVGVALATFVYMGGHISGGHYNPAVTFALYLNKKIDQADALRYGLTQLVAGLAASLIYLFIFGSKFLPTTASSANFLTAFLVELLFTFLLCFVVLNVAASSKTKGNQYYGLAIGLALMVGAFAGGPISGGAFNPAVGVGPLLFDFTHLSTHLGNILLYLIGPLSGGALAAYLFKNID